MLISLDAEGMHFPRPSDGRMKVSFDWVPIRYRNVISVLKNPFYAGVYVYGKTRKRTEMVDGRVRKSYGHRKAREDWVVMLRESIMKAISAGTSMSGTRSCSRPTPTARAAVKRGRGGRALLAGMLTCGHVAACASFMSAVASVINI